MVFDEIGLHICICVYAQKGLERLLICSLFERFA